MVAPGNPYATNEGWSIAGRDYYDNRQLTNNHDCLHRGAGAHAPKVLVQVGVPEWNSATRKWVSEQVGVSQECQQGAEIDGDDAGVVVKLPSQDEMASNGAGQ